MFTSCEALTSAQRTADAKTKEQIPLYEDKGLDLFYGQNNQASLTDLSEKRSNCGGRRGGLGDVVIYGNDTENGNVWGMIHNPSVDKKTIMTRQHVIESLMRDGQVLRQLWQERNGGYELEGTLQYLYKQDETESAREKRSLGEYRAKSRIDQIIEMGITSENYGEKVEDAKNRLGTVSEDERGMLEAICALERLKTALPKTRQFAQTLKKIDNPTLKNIAMELEALIDQVPRMTVADFLQDCVANDTSRIDGVRKAAGRLSACTARIGGLLNAAMIVQENNCGKATFNEAMPRSYQDSWNFLKKKDERCGWGKRKNIKQVTNDSPADNPVTILSGSNMSGKTFFMRQDMYVQLWAQAFGYVPAANGNFPELYDSFVFVDRASTDAANNLSAFGNEVALWKKAVEKCSGKACLYADESYSTTSPEDQYRLLTGTVMYLRGKGVRVMMANHNEDFLRRLGDHAECGIYHFETAAKDNGDIDFLYRLKKGVDESHALQVAKRMQMPSPIVEYATTYMEGGTLNTSERARPIKPVETYSNEEREALKKEQGSFRILLPDTDELIDAEQGRGRRSGNLRWRVSEENHTLRYVQLEPPHKDWGDEDEESQAGNETEAKAKQEPFFLLLSRDSDFHYRFAHGQLGKIEHEKLLRFVQDLLLRGASNNPKEILERQSMFTQLVTDKKYERIHEQINGLWRFMWTAMNANPQSFERFNTQMLNGAYEAIAGTDSSEPNADEFKFFLATVRMNAELLGLNLEKLGIEETLKSAERVIELQEAFSAVPYLEHTNDEGENRRRQRERDEASDRFQDEAFCVAKLKRDRCNDYGFAKPMKKLAMAVHGVITPHVKDISLTDANLQTVAKQIDGMKKVMADAWKQMFMMNNGLKMGLCLEALVSETRHVDNLLREMRAIDSVHLHRLANYLEQILAKYFVGNMSGPELLAAFKKAREEDVDEWDDDSHTKKLERGMNSENFDRVKTELERLWGLLSFAQVIHQDEYTPVLFNETGEVAVKDGWSMAEKKEKQVRNDTHFRPDERTHLVTGTNMSGKTFHMKRDIFAQLCAHATGYAPAEHMTTPVFDRVMYLDRVNTNLDNNLSAFGNEVEFWKRFFGSIAEGQQVFAAVDEAFSTTSPRYQDALTFAVSQHLLEQGQTLSIASHNHNFVKRFMAQNPKNTSAHHFQTHIGDDGNISFDYKKREGHERSHALLVAKKMGMPDEILQLAEMI